MLNLRIVPVTHMQQVWSEVSPLLASAMVHSAGEYDLNQLKVMLVDGKQTLLVLVDENDKIQTAFTIEWVNFPNHRIAFMTSIGGRTDVNAFNQFKDWVKAHGGTKIQGAAFEAVAKLWNRKFKFENKYIIVEYTL